MHPEVKQYETRQTNTENNLGMNWHGVKEDNEDTVWQNFIEEKAEKRSGMFSSERYDCRQSGLQIQYARKFEKYVFV